MKKDQSQVSGCMRDLKLILLMCNDEIHVNTNFEAVRYGDLTDTMYMYCNCINDFSYRNGN